MTPQQTQSFVKTVRVESNNASFEQTEAVPTFVLPLTTVETRRRGGASAVDARCSGRERARRRGASRWRPPRRAVVRVDGRWRAS
jgi:hypothetical protein